MISKLEEGISMYKNIGKKIMNLAKFLGWFGLIAGLGTSLFLLIPALDEEIEFWIFLIPFIAGLLSVLSSWPLYGFGQLVDDVRIMKDGANGSAKESKEELPSSRLQ